MCVRPSFHCRESFSPGAGQKIDPIIGGVSSVLHPLQTSGYWNYFLAAMESPLSFDCPQSSLVPSFLLRNTYEGEVWERGGTLPSVFKY